MARNVTLQVLRGVQGDLASLQSQSPLAMGEMFFATDTGNLFFGTPGVGLGYIQLGDTTQVNEKLTQLIVIMESMRRALVAMACNDKPREQDFDLNYVASELTKNQAPAL
jgi:hypothetical protein